MKHLYTLLLSALLLCAAQIHAASFTVNEMVFNITDSATHSVEVGINTHLSGDIVIPETVTDTNSVAWTVTGVGEFAFYVVSIGNTTITSITLPNTITTIKRNALGGLKGINSFVMPNSVSSIETQAFINCTNLRELTLSNSLTSLSSECFVGCSSLEKVILPDSLKTIDGYVFLRCTALAKVILGDSLKTIESSAFRGCTALSEVVVGNALETIKSKAFIECTALKDFTITTLVPPTVDEYSFKYEDMEAMNAEVMEVNLAPNITLHVPAEAIAAYAIASIWEDFDTIVAISTIGDTITDASGNSYIVETDGTVSFNKVIKPGTPDSITVPDSITANGKTYAVTSIADQAFYYTTIKSITLPSTITSIGSSAFASCANLTDINIPAGVDSIGSFAFSSCPALDSIDMPDSLSYLGSAAFYGCTNLTSIELGNKVTSIGVQCFYNCTSLKTVKIGNAVESIYREAFYNCSAMTDFTSGTPNPPYVGDNAFTAAASSLRSTTPESTEPENTNASYTANVTLHVATAHEAAYMAAVIWEDFYYVSTGLESDVIEPVSLYPNPAGATLYVATEEAIDILNASGLELISGASSPVDVSALAAGIYFVKAGNSISSFIKE